MSEKPAFVAAAEGTRLLMNNRVTEADQLEKVNGTRSLLKEKAEASVQSILESQE